MREAHAATAMEFIITAREKHNNGKQQISSNMTTNRTEQHLLSYSGLMTKTHPPN
jgi:hypothetical protein